MREIYKYDLYIINETFIILRLQLNFKNTIENIEIISISAMVLYILFYNSISIIVS